VQDGIYSGNSENLVTIKLSNDLQNITIRNNLVFGGGLKGDDDHDVPQVMDNLIGIDPLFRDAENYDFRISPGSSAIDAGIAKFAPDIDIEGNPRPQGSGYDLGAYEYVLKPGETTLRDANSRPQATDAHAIFNTPTVSKPTYLEHIIDPIFRTRITRITGDAGVTQGGVTWGDSADGN